VFLGTVGSTASFGTLAYATRRTSDTLEVRIWLSEQAATYDGVGDRIRSYLDETLSLEYWTLEASIGGTVSVSTEDAARLTRRGVARGSRVGDARRAQPRARVGRQPAGDRRGMKQAPTGYGVPHIASVGGARHLAALESFDDVVTDDARAIAPNTTPVRTMQVLLHEIGHALGLNHEDGVAFVSDGALTATPMLSSYAWDPEYKSDASPCGSAIPAAADRKRTLSFAFSTCARRRLADYDGEVPF